MKVLCTVMTAAGHAYEVLGEAALPEAEMRMLGEMAAKGGLVGPEYRLRPVSPGLMTTDE